MTTDTLAAIDALLLGDVGDVRRYAEDALRVLRRIRRTDVWLQVYERGLKEAYRQHDMDGLAAVVSLAAFRFDANAQFDQVLSHFEFALAMADGLPDAVTMLQSMKAPALVMQGDLVGAIEALQIAKRSAPLATSDRAQLEYRACSAAVSCMAIGSDTSTVRRAVGFAEQAGAHSSAAFVLTWLIPLMFALGAKDESDPWIRALRVHAEELAHPHRMADAYSYSVARSAAWGPSEETLPPSLATESENWLAALRLMTLQLRDCVLRGEWTDATERFGELEKMRGRISRGSAEALPLYGLVLDAFGSSELPSPREPQVPTLLNLGGLLASAEATSIAGTQRDAVKWLNWIEKSLPREVRTSLEWPVARDRVVGLLRVRAGSVREAVRAFRDAIDWAGKAGYEAEAALAQVQLAEVLSLSEIASSERARQRLRKAGWMKLQELNIDPTPHAYAATRALALRDDVSTRPQLTPRQVEVLSLLADGMTYKQAADRLGTSWRTVSTQAYQAYDRLGVNGKHEAVQVARQLQIL